jgi:hypothetical protein
MQYCAVCVMIAWPRSPHWAGCELIDWLTGWLYLTARVLLLIMTTLTEQSVGLPVIRVLFQYGANSRLSMHEVVVAYLCSVQNYWLYTRVLEMLQNYWLSLQVRKIRAWIVAKAWEKVAFRPSVIYRAYLLQNKTTHQLTNIRFTLKLSSLENLKEK